MAPSMAPSTHAATPSQVPPDRGITGKAFGHSHQRLWQGPQATVDADVAGDQRLLQDLLKTECARMRELKRSTTTNCCGLYVIPLHNILNDYISSHHLCI